MIKIIAFDLDNTLYDHSQYVEGAYSDIAKFVSYRHNINQDIYHKWIFNLWIEKGSSYTRIFKESYDYFQLDHFDKDIEQILEIYHKSEPVFSLYEGTIEVLDELSGKYKLVLITDGKERTQNYKLQQLKLKSKFMAVYISGKLGAAYYKPSSKMFELCLENEDIKPYEMFYVGDNPDLDYEPCKKLGIGFIRILKGEHKNVPFNNQYSIYDIRELPKLVEKMECNNQ